MVVGPQGPQVASGPNGQDGAQGQTGATGPAGSDGTSWYPVQLCPGTTHYPDTFCEVAFCYGNTLYGTYSANGGFSSELPQGAYSSNGINCQCNVNIGTDCQVSQ